MADKAKSAAPKESFEAKLVKFGSVFILIFLVVIPVLLAAFNIDSDSIFDLDAIKEFFITVISTAFTTITFIAIFFTLILTLLIMYTKTKKEQVMKKWADSQSVLTVSKAPAPVVSAPGATLIDNLPGVNPHAPQADAGNERWKDVEGKINSANPSDWRLAILEADIMLQDMLEQMGMPGATLGEKLKAADPSFFGTLQEAWAAHKIRNIIAHEGTAYNLTFNEARRAIDLYRRVFEEFFYI